MQVFHAIQVGLQVHFPYLAFVVVAFTYIAFLMPFINEWRWALGLLTMALMAVGVSIAWLGAGFMAVLSNSGSLELTASNARGPFWLSLVALCCLLALNVILARLARLGLRKCAGSLGGQRVQREG